MTDRQRKILKQIIKLYISQGEPVGSKTLIHEYNLEFSSATIRNEMKELEKEGFLEKAHTSSGRIPSVKGYKFYAEKLANEKDEDLYYKIQKIFEKRRISIDATLDEAISAISKIAGLTMVSTSKESDELMKSIQLTPLNQNAGIVVIVTSTGRVISKLIDFNERTNIEDVRIAIRIFKERLTDTKLSDLSSKAELLAPILEDSIQNFENVIKTFMIKIFDFHNKIKNRIYGNSSLINQHDIKREDIAKLVDVIEKKSIWEFIESKVNEDEKIKIDIKDNNISLLSKKIQVGKVTKEISVIGSHRMNYSEAKQILKMLEIFLEDTKKEG